MSELELIAALTNIGLGVASGAIWDWMKIYSGQFLPRDTAISDLRKIKEVGTRAEEVYLLLEKLNMLAPRTIGGVVIEGGSKVREISKNEISKTPNAIRVIGSEVDKISENKIDG